LSRSAGGTYLSIKAKKLITVNLKPFHFNTSGEPNLPKQKKTRTSKETNQIFFLNANGYGLTNSGIQTENWQPIWLYGYN
jgi:hypothetical protein